MFLTKNRIPQFESFLFWRINVCVHIGFWWTIITQTTFGLGVSANFRIPSRRTGKLASKNGDFLSNTVSKTLYFELPQRRLDSDIFFGSKGVSGCNETDRKNPQKNRSNLFILGAKPPSIGWQGVRVKSQQNVRFVPSPLHLGLWFVEGYRGTDGCHWSKNR